MYLTVHAKHLITVIANDGGYETGRCSLCAEVGFLDNKFGYPYNTDQMRNRLVHTQQCELGRRLKKDGKVKRPEAKKRQVTRGITCL